MDKDYPRIAVVTSTDHGPIVNVASWILMVTAILFTIFRLVSNLVIRGKYGDHDLYVVIADTFAIGQTIASSLMVAHGLGQHENKLSNAQLDSFQKALLASSVLYIATLAANKFSLLVFVSGVLAPGQAVLRRVVLIARILIGLYLVASIFTLSFSCNLPKTYDILNGQCIDLEAFWVVHTVADILACLTIFFLPLIIVHPLQMSKSLKAQIVFPFALEIPLVAFSVVRLVYLRRALSSDDITWDSLQWQIWTQISMHLGVVAANIPCLKMFLKGFESMLFRQDTANIERSMASHSGTRYANDRSGPGWSGWRGNGSGERSDRNSRKSRGWKIGDGSELRPGDGETTAIVGASSALGPGSDGASDKLQDGRARDKIYKTTEWTVLGE